MTTLPDPAELLNLREIAAELKVGRATIQRWAKTRELPAVKVGKEYRVRRRDLEAWIDGKRIVPMGEEETSRAGVGVAESRL